MPEHSIERCAFKSVVFTEYLPLTSQFWLTKTTKRGIRRTTCFHMASTYTVLSRPSRAPVQLEGSLQTGNGLAAGDRTLGEAARS